MICPNCKEIYSEKICPRCGCDCIAEEDFGEENVPKPQKDDDSKNEPIYWLLSGIIIIAIIMVLDKMGLGLREMFKGIFGTIKALFSVD